MENLKFIQIIKGNEKQYQQLFDLWLPYIREIDAHKNISNQKSDDEIIEGARLRADIQGNREDMHFELCYSGDELIGFGFFAVDLGGIKGIIEPGYGYIMEFYISPDKRRKGYGSLMFKHIKDVFKGHSAKYIYLTPDLASGVPFWESLGFVKSSKVDPDNKMPIFIMEL